MFKNADRRSALEDACLPAYIKQKLCARRGTVFLLIISRAKYFPFYTTPAASGFFFNLLFSRC